MLSPQLCKGSSSCPNLTPAAVESLPLGVKCGGAGVWHACQSTWNLKKNLAVIQYLNKEAGILRT